MKRSGLVVALVALVACGSGHDDHNGGKCRAAAGDLAHYLATIDHDASVVPYDNTRHLVTRSDLPHRKLARAPFVDVDSTSIYFEGRAADLEDLEARLAHAFAKNVDPTRRASDDSKRIYLLIDDDVAWGRVSAVARAASDAGFDRPSWLFRRPPAPPLPVAEAASSDHEASPLEPTPKPVTCGALQHLFTTINLSDGEGDKAEMLIAGIGPALVECRCNVDLPALRIALAGLIGEPHPMTALDVTLAPDGTPLALPATMPWREANKQLVAEGRVWPIVAR